MKKHEVIDWNDVDAELAKERDAFTAAVERTFAPRPSEPMDDHEEPEEEEDDDGDEEEEEIETP
jgi:hypothetical protein